MTEIAAALEATALAQFLKVSAWVYPLVNAGHILGIALLVGAVLPMDVALLRGDATLVSRLRPWAAAGLVLAVLCGLLLFITQASDYIVNHWFQAKIALVALTALNAVIHLRHTARHAALISLAAWPAALVCGRMIAYS